MELGLHGKVVAITGGGTGIGRAAALEFLKEGCRVAICGRRREMLEAAAKEAKAMGYRLLSVQADIMDYNSLESFAKTVKDEYGRIDVWINNAGGNKIKPLIEYTKDEFIDIINLNLTSVFCGCKIAYPYLKETKGVILNAASFAALSPNAGRAPYSAAKAGVLSLTKTFAAEFAADGIRTLAYVPGMIETEMTRATLDKYRDNLLKDIPAKRFGKPEDLAKVIVFMASDAAGYINGAYVEISGGKRCVQNPHYSFEG